MPNINCVTCGGSRSNPALTLVVIALASAAMSASPAAAQDGRTIMQNMASAYQRLTSYRGQSKGTVRQIRKNGAQVAQDGFTTTLTYQKPNKLKLEFVMPYGGRAIYCDGQTLSYYNNQSQTFASTPRTPKDMREVAACLLELQIAGRYDALYFLSGNRLPSNVTGLQRLPDSKRNDRPVYVVTGHETTRTNDIKWTWMIDKQTMMLARVEGRTWNGPGTVQITVNNNPLRNREPLEGIITQSILLPTLNTQIASSEFEFKVPQNAKSVKFSTVVAQQKRDFSGSSAAPAVDR